MAEKKSKLKSFPVSGLAFIHSTYNNTIITITTKAGDTLCQSSAGRKQKGARKATAFAGEEAAQALAQHAANLGMSEINVKVKGWGQGREKSIVGLSRHLKVLSIREVTPLPHNGTRARKKKRV
jgi:small subunit ribosomal protein S11